MFNDLFRLVQSLDHDFSEAHGKRVHSCGCRRCALAAAIQIASSSFPPMRRSRISARPAYKSKYYFPPRVAIGTSKGHSASPTGTIAWLSALLLVGNDSPIYSS